MDPAARGLLDSNDNNSLRHGDQGFPLALALQSGAGIALLPSAFAARSGALVSIPLPAGLPTRQPWLIVHRDLRQLPAVRIVQKWIVSAFASL